MLTKLIERAKNILVAPRAEWSAIANEPASVGLHTIYFLALAAIPAVLQFLKLSVVGTSMLASGLTSLFLGIALSLVTMYLLALIVDALAPRFSGKQNFLQSRKTVAYAYTASLIASIAIIAPKWWMIAVGLAAIYASYLLYVGLQTTMQCPRDKAAGYAVVTVVVGVLLSFAASSVVSQIVSIGYDRDDSDVTADKGSPASLLHADASQPEPADAPFTDATQAQKLPARAPAEALPPEQLKPFVPDTLLGRERTNLSVERVKEMGVETTRATAYFTDESGRTVELQVTDLGQAKSAVGLSSFVNVEEGESNAGSSYEKTYRDGGDLVTEKWNDNTSTGEYSVLVADRFAVKVSGQAYNIDELKAVTAELDLATLEGMVGGGGK